MGLYNIRTTTCISLESGQFASIRLSLSFSWRSVFLAHDVRMRLLHFSKYYCIVAYM